MTLWGIQHMTLALCFAAWVRIKDCVFVPLREGQRLNHSYRDTDVKHTLVCTKVPLQE